MKNILDLWVVIADVACGPSHDGSETQIQSLEDYEQLAAVNVKPAV